VKAKTRQEVLKILSDQMHKLHQVLLQYSHPAPSGFKSEEGDADYPLKDKENDIARWAYDNCQAAGYGTDNLPAGRGYYIPLKTHRMILGLMAFAFEQPEIALTPENKEIFETMAFLWSSCHLNAYNKKRTSSEVASVAYRCFVLQ